MVAIAQEPEVDATVWGTGGPEFKSRRSDHKTPIEHEVSALPCPGSRALNLEHSGTESLLPAPKVPKQSQGCSASVHGPTYWHIVGKFDRDACALADRHYSRRKVGSPQFMPPGQTIVLLGMMHDAVFGWWRPHPAAGIRAMNNLDGWTCTIFRNEGRMLSSNLVLQAELALAAIHGCGPDGMLTYVWDRKVKSQNPGYCFKMAGWKAIGRSADGRKTLLQKPFSSAGATA